MAGEETGFKSTLRSIGEKLQDVTELNVRTYTGTISGAVGGAGGGNPPTAKEVMDNAFQAGSLEVVGLTSMMLDGDIDQFISNNNAHAGLLDVHVESVKTGQATRKAVFDLFTGAVKKLIDK